MKFVHIYLYLTSSLKKHQYKPEKFRALLLSAILLFCSISSMAAKAAAMHSESLQEGIAEEIIRFHVIANSDSKKDQSLKLTVKDALVSSLSPLLSNTKTLKEARNVLSGQLTNIQSLAESVLKENGYSYPVTVTLEKNYFPLKVYGNYTFPPGYYEALRVQIGEGKGKNWWCLMFPPLCFVDETYSIVDKKSGDKLKTLLTEEEYCTLIDKKTPVKIKFKLFEIIKELIN